MNRMIADGEGIAALNTAQFDLLSFELSPVRRVQILHVVLSLVVEDGAVFSRDVLVADYEVGPA